MSTRRLLMLMTTTIALLVASIAMGSPIEWRYEQVDDELVWSMTANQRFDNVSLTIAPRSRESSDVFSRPSWERGERWVVRTARPQRASSIRLSFHADADGEEWSASVDVPVERARSAADAIDFDVIDWSIDEGSENRVTIRTTRPMRRASLGVRNTDGQWTEPVVQIDEDDADVYTLRWPDDSDSEVLTFAITAVDDGNNSRENRFVPWSLSGEVQHLNFAFGSSEIAEEDMERLSTAAAELRAAVERVGRWVNLELYVAGYTDTVGSALSNQRLSEERARAIAEFFVRHGVNVPVRTQGFGEDVLAVETPDNTPSSSNRRAVFVLRAGPPPRDERFPRDRWRRFTATR